MLNFCSKCHQEHLNLVQVFDVDDQDDDDLDDDQGEAFDPTVWLCRNCLVGRTVPVFRQNENKWNFGVIVSSDPNSLKCQVQFDANDNTEWVDVEATPYTKYLDHWKGQGDTSSSPTQVHDLDEELNFEPLSIDTTLSFEDSKVMSLPSGFSFANIFEVPDSPIRFTKSILEETDFMPDNNDWPIVSLVPDPPMFPIVPPYDYPMPAPPPHVYATTDYGNIFRDVSVENLEERTKEIVIASPKPKEETTPSRPLNQRLWTEQEDALLRSTIDSNEPNFKWPDIAKAIPGRTGKQCRERYLNHLRPKLKMAPWSVTEDALLLHMYHLEGSRWAMISKVLPGRTDNGIKNRFHHLKRRFEKHCSTLSYSAEMDQFIASTSRSGALAHQKVGKNELKCLAGHVLNKMYYLEETDASFGQFRPPHDDLELCARCGLCVPSEQTGRLVCTKTGWCQTCAKVAPFLSGDVLRTVHKMTVEE